MVLSLLMKVRDASLAEFRAGRPAQTPAHARAQVLAEFPDAKVEATLSSKADKSNKQQLLLAATAAGVAVNGASFTSEAALLKAIRAARPECSCSSVNINGKPLREYSDGAQVRPPSGGRCPYSPPV